MPRILIKVCILATLLATPVSAQTTLNDTAADDALLKKDLKQAITEAEGRSGDDLPLLFWRLNLYRRAAHPKKIEQTVKQIITAAESENQLPRASQHLIPILKDPIFTNTEVLQRYLRSDFNGDVFSKLIDLCVRRREKCDISGFDAWLQQKARSSEAGDAERVAVAEHWDWIGRRLDWRGRLGLDTGVILDRFAEDVRNDPGDLEAALRYVRFNRNVQELAWLADNFKSESAFDHYELGTALAFDRFGVQLTEDERALIRQAAARLLLRSLSLPFADGDVARMYSYRLRHVSVSPNIKNHEKQLRFWTKTELAEVYRKLGRPQDAQPIIEELMNTDTSDIISTKPSQLAGSVQAVSGARVVESKILAEQASRETSYGYWEERIQYYLGRKEPERVFDAFLQAFSSMPYGISDKSSSGHRLHFIRRFVDFSTRPNYQLFTAEVNDWDKLKGRFLKDAESFLRAEFEKTASNAQYSYELIEIIDNGDFENLLDDILVKNSHLLIDAADTGLISRYSVLTYRFFDSEAVPQARKDEVFSKLVKIAEGKDLHRALLICDAIDGLGVPSYAAQLVPLLNQNLKAVELKMGRSKPGGDYHSGLKRIREEYVKVLFYEYLASNDRASAEKLLMVNFSMFGGSAFDRLALNAAKSDAFTDAVRYWKIKANLDRRDLESLGSLAAFPAVAMALRAFYEQMKISEPYSPVPEMALKILR